MGKKSLIIEEENCWGCMACQVACKQEHISPDGINLIRIEHEWIKKEDGRLEFTYRVKRCIQCDEPPCAEVCPESAIRKREDSIVVIESELCTGCGLCIDECPYDAIMLDNVNIKAVKCDMCHQRIDAGLLPACADNICLGRCIYLSVNNK